MKLEPDDHWKTTTEKTYQSDLNEARWEGAGYLSVGLLLTGLFLILTYNLYVPNH